MKKKLFAMLLSAAMLLGLFTGCGGTAASTVTEPSAASQEAEIASTPTEEEAAPEEVEIPDEISSEFPSASEEEDAQTVEHQYRFPNSENALLDYSNEYSLPLCEETQTLTWMRNALSLMGPLGELGLNTLQDLDAIEHLQEITNVNIEYTELDFFTAQEKMNIAIASGDYAAIISDLSYTGGNTAALSDDIIVNLTDKLEEYSPNYAYLIDSNPTYASYFRNDGLVLCYQSPYESFINNQGMVIRKDWLEEQNLEVPTTYDEMFEVLKVFKDAYNTNTAIYFNSDCVINGLTVGYDVASFSASGGATSLPYYVEDGTVKCSLIEDGYRDYLEEMHKWYTEGLMDSDFISVAYDPMGSYLTGLVSSSAVGVWCTSGEGLGNIEVPISCVPNLTVEEGGIDHLTSTSLLTDSTNTYITSCCEDVELAMRFCDYLYSEDGILFYNYGFEGEDYTIDENGQPQFTDAVINNEYGVDVSNYMRIRAPYTLCSSMMLRYRTAAYNTDIANEAWGVWSSNLDGTMFIPSNVSMNNEETETSSYYVADIVTYASQMIPQFITGDEDLGDWDSFVASLKDMNIETCIAAVQSAYDRCME
jgi:putative aldouronate transport system substrate-binding protein